MERDLRKLSKLIGGGQEESMAFPPFRDMSGVTAIRVGPGNIYKESPAQIEKRKAAQKLYDEIVAAHKRGAQP